MNRQVKAAYLKRLLHLKTKRLVTEIERDLTQLRALVSKTEIIAAMLPNGLAHREAHYRSTIAELHRRIQFMEESRLIVHQVMSNTQTP